MCMALMHFVCNLPKQVFTRCTHGQEGAVPGLEVQKYK